MTEDGGNSRYDGTGTAVAGSMRVPLFSFWHGIRSGAQGPESLVLVTGTRNSGQNEQLSSPSHVKRQQL
jgi:hypothetical protein